MKLVPAVQSPGWLEPEEQDPLVSMAVSLEGDTTYLSWAIRLDTHDGTPGVPLPLVLAIGEDVVAQLRERLGDRWSIHQIET